MRPPRKAVSVPCAALGSGGRPEGELRGPREGSQGKKDCHPSGRGAHGLPGGALGSGPAPWRRRGLRAGPGALGRAAMQWRGLGTARAPRAPRSCSQTARGGLSPGGGSPPRAGGGGGLVSALRGKLGSDPRGRVTETRPATSPGPRGLRRGADARRHPRDTWTGVSRGPGASAHADADLAHSHMSLAHRAMLTSHYLCYCNYIIRCFMQNYPPRTN